MSVTGIAELQAALRDMASRIEAATPMAVDTATNLVKDRARVNLALKSHARGTLTPSAPDEPPAKITGDLRDSFEILGPTPAGAAAWRAVLGPTIVYARIQELGGKTGRGGATTLPSRPYLKPAVEELLRSGALANVFNHAWGAAIAGG